MPGAAVDAKTAETCSARPGLRRPRDSAGDVKDSDGRLRRVLARSTGLQRLQRRSVARAGQLQPGRLHETHRPGPSNQTLINRRH